MSIYFQAEQVFIQQTPARAIHPDMLMDNPDFLKGYAIGLKAILHPEDASGSPIITAEEVVQEIKTCALEEPSALAHSIGYYVGCIIGKCH
jgi:hypothetical protein